MKNLNLLSCLVLFVFAACNSAQRDEAQTLPLQVAEAYGFDRVEEVESFEYTWNVRRDNGAVLSRTWNWNLQTGDVSYTGPDTAVQYNLAEKDTALRAIDHSFINDKYWLLFPFQLAWDTGYEYETLPDQTAPISGDNATKLTIRYNDEDGYTPGDAYDLYLDGDNRIIEWVFRKGNAESGRAMTWENVRDFNGIKITLDHKDASGNTILWFSDVSVN